MEIVSILIPPQTIWEVRAQGASGEPHYRKVELLMYCRDKDMEQKLRVHFPNRDTPTIETFYSTELIPLISSWTKVSYHENDRRGRCICGEKKCRFVRLHQGDHFSPSDRSWIEANQRATVLDADLAKKTTISAKAKAKREESLV